MADFPAHANGLDAYAVGGRRIVCFRTEEWEEVGVELSLKPNASPLLYQFGNYFTSLQTFLRYTLGFSGLPFSCVNARPKNGPKKAARYKRPRRTRRLLRNPNASLPPVYLCLTVFTLLAYSR